jgi:hypothetical protein
MANMDAGLGVGSGVELARASAVANRLASVDTIEQQIQQHHKADSEQSYIGKIFNAAYNRDEQSLKRLETELQTAKATGKISETAQDSLDRDRQAVSMQGDINQYGTGFLRTAFLFMNGRTGLIGTVAVGALNEAKPADAMGTQALDAILGGTKGGAMKGVFNVLGGSQVDIFTKGVGLSLASRIIDTGLTRNNWLDPASNKFSTERAWNAMQENALNMNAVGTDALMYAAGASALKVLSIGPNMSPFAKTVAAGGIFGFTNGATSEVIRQQHAGEEFNFSKVFQKAAIQGGLDAVAATAGGVQNQRIFDKEVKLQNPIADALKEERTPDGKVRVVNEYRTPAVETSAQQAEKPIEVNTAKGTVTAKAGDWVVQENGRTTVVPQDQFPRLYEAIEGKPGGFWLKPQYMWVAELEKAVSRRAFSGQVVEGKPGDHVVVSQEGRLAKILAPEELSTLQHNYPAELSPRVGAEIGMSLGQLTDHPDPIIREAANDFNKAIDQYKSRQRMFLEEYGRLPNLPDPRSESMQKAAGTLEQVKTQYGDQSPQFAERLKLLGRISWDNDPNTTLGLYQHAAEIQMKSGGANSPDFASTMHDIGFLMRAFGRPVAAEQAFNVYHNALNHAPQPVEAVK